MTERTQQAAGWMMRMAALALALLVLAGGTAQAKLERYWPAFPKPKTLVVTGDWQKLPAMGQGDSGGEYGAWAFTVQSLAGLAALSVKEGHGDTMIWISEPASETNRLWLETTLGRIKARRVDATDPWALLQRFVGAGVVKGYVLYKHQGHAHGKPVATLDQSVNVATSLCALTGGVLVDERFESEFQKRGLKKLADGRETDVLGLLGKYGDKLYPGLVFMLNPASARERDQAVATRAVITYGVTPTTEKVYQWARPNSPISGWGHEGEDNMTMQHTRYALFNTAAFGTLNMPVMSTMEAGREVPWSDVQVNAKSQVDPLALPWLRDTHLTSFMNSDGDALGVIQSTFLENPPQFWRAERRGTFAMGWGTSAACMSQMALPSLEYIAKTATGMDNIVIQGGGYYYPAEYGHALTSDTTLLDKHIAQIAERMDRLGVRMISMINMDWDSSRTLAAYERYAQGIPNLAGILAIQYCPYNGGMGKTLWVKNKQGAPIPVISARFCIWNKLREYENNAPPAVIAQKINAMAHQGALDSEEHFDWTIIHYWSFFKKAEGSKDPWAQEIEPSEMNRQDVGRGVQAAAWTVDALAPHVKVVTPVELAWQMRLHLKTRETLDALAADLSNQAKGERKQALKDYRAWLAKAELKDDAAKEAAFNKLKALAK